MLWELLYALLLKFIVALVAINIIQSQININ